MPTLTRISIKYTILLFPLAFSSLAFYLQEEKPGVLNTVSYYFSDGNATFTGTGLQDVLQFVDVAPDSFDHRNFSFLAVGDSLIIYPDNGQLVTLHNHFVDDVSRFETLLFPDGSSIDLAGSVFIVDKDNGNENGTPGADILLGGIKRNKLRAGRGNDIIYGGDGDDLLHVESGNNTLYGGKGNDVLQGQHQIDRLYGGDGNDELLGDSAPDTLYGGAGKDRLKGESGDDLIFGGDGNDNIYGGIGNDILHGEDGDDTFRSGPGGDLVYCGNGDDKVRFKSESGNDRILGQAGNDRLYGGNGNDTIFGGNGNDLLDNGLDPSGGGGNPTTSNYEYLNGGSGNDELVVSRFKRAEVFGGTGNDFYKVAYSSISDDTEALVFDELGAADTLELPNISAVHNFTVLGVDLVITHISTTYNRILTVREQFTPLHRIETIYFKGGGSFVMTEELTELDDNYTATASTSPLGIDHNTVDALEGNDVVYLGSGNDLVYGRAGDDVLHGQAGNDNLQGGLGNDLLYGGNGDDVADGGDGRDSLMGYNGNDKLIGGAGNDFLNGEADHDTLYGGIGNDLLLAGNGNDILYGGADADTLNAFNGNDVLYGDAGNDALNGESGDDMLYGGEGSDILSGGGDDDVLLGEDGDDLLYGGHGNDRIYGGSGMDSLYGWSGDDLFESGLGADVIYTEAGSDTVVFAMSTAFNGVDTLMDINKNFDKIYIGQLLESYDPATDSLSDFVQITDHGTYSTLEVDTAGTSSYSTIAILEGLTGLANVDQLVANGFVLLSL